MTTRSSSSSSSSSESEITSGRVREISETSRDTSHVESHRRNESPTNTIDGTSLADTTTARSIRSASPSASHTSATVSAGQTGYDTVSIATTTNTGVTNATAPSQSSVVAGGIPIIRPPVLQQQSGTGLGVFGPQRPGGYPTQPHPSAADVGPQQPIKIDVAAAQHQYQQRNVQTGASPYAGSTSSSAGSLSSPGGVSVQRPPPPPQQQQQQQQQTHFDAAKAIFVQADANRDGSISRDEFRQWAQGGSNQAGAQYQQQQQQLHAQFPNQIPASQVYNELLGPDAFKDVILDIDYGALGGFNAAFQSGGDFGGGQLPPGINIRPAYTSVDSLNYQQHMFNTARTINAESASNAYDFSAGAGSNYNTGGQQFDAAKAIFNQVDTNHDGGISRDEFRQWAQPVQQQNYGGQAYSSAANYQTSYNAGGNNGLYQASLFDGADPSVANILQQSGLGQVVPNQ